MSKTQKNYQRFQGFESLRDFGEDIKEQIDVKSSWDEVWNEVLGLKKKASDFKKSEQPEQLTVTNPFFPEKQDVFEASKHQNSSENVKKEKAHVQKEAAINYHGDVVKSSERTSKKEMHEINQRLQEIMAELQRIVSSSKVLQMEFAGVTVDQTPQQAGEYHLNFFDWLLLTIRDARKKVEDSGAWLATKKKKGSKGRWNNKQRKDWFANTSLSMGNESGGGYINQTG